MTSIIHSSRNAFKRSVARAYAPTASVAGRRYSSTMHDNDPEILEAEKMRNLSKQQHKTSTPLPGAPGWNESLASASEAAVKADRDGGSPAEMQARTVQYIKDRHHADDAPTFTEPPPMSEPVGVSPNRMRNGADEAEASYARDEVDGPLKQARGTVVEKVEHKEDIITRKQVA